MSRLTLLNQSCGFSSSFVWLWELDHKEGWVPKNWYFSNCGVGEDSLESLGLWGEEPVNPKGTQCWIFTGRTEAEALIFEATWLEELTHWKRPCCWERLKKGMTEDEIVGWHHWLNGYEFEQVPGVGEGQGSPACCNFMELQRVGHDGATELNWYSKLKKKYTIYNCRFQLLYGIFFSKFIDNRWWNWNVNNILHDDYKITETEWSFIIL